MPVHIEGVETVREPDGLAKSSRNTYLSAEQRLQAPVIQQALQTAARRFEEGERRPARLAAAARGHIERNSAARVDYVQCRSSADLTPLAAARPGETLIAAAAWFGSTRLIDNIRI